MNPIGGMGGGMPLAGMQRMSPEMKIGQELQSMSESGAISSQDQEALSSALYAIGGELRSERTAGATKPPSAEAMQEKVDGLIGEQVEAGTLTEEQAKQLSDLFEEMASQRPEHGKTGRSPGAGKAEGQGGEQNMLGQFLQQMQEQSASSYGATGTLSADGSMLMDYVA